MRLLLVEAARPGGSFLEQLLRREPDIDLLPPVHTGRDALAGVRRWNPQLVLMDLVLAGSMDGVETIEQIMSTQPCPIVALHAPGEGSEGDRSFDCLSAGAVEVLARPRVGGPEAVKEFRERLLRTVRTMAHARVVGRKRPVPRGAGLAVPESARYSLLVLGGSKGAPPLVYELIRALPVPAPFPVVVAQHIVQGFEPGFAQWLSGTGHLAVVAQGGEWLEAGRVYVAPADKDLVVKGGRLKTQPARGLAVPSVNVIFESVASGYGDKAVGLLLSGMGSDGAQGLLAMRQAGALTVVQEGSTCVVDGMPAAARTLGAATRILTPPEMVDLMVALARASAPPPHPRNGTG